MKRIQKKFQGTVPANKILDMYSESLTDTYSCNKINEFLNNVSGGVTEETDPTVPEHVKNITEGQIERWDREAEYELPTASADTLGGIKVGENLSIDINGVLSAKVVEFSGNYVETTLPSTASHVSKLFYDTDKDQIMVNCNGRMGEDIPLAYYSDLENKQDKLTAGDNITIDENNVISFVPETGTTREVTVTGSYVRLFTLNFPAYYKSTSIWFTLSDTQATKQDLLCNLYVYAGSSSAQLISVGFKYIDVIGRFNANLVAVVTSNDVVEVYYKMGENDSPTLNILSHSRHLDTDTYGAITIDMQTVVSALPSGTSISAVCQSNYKVGDVVVTSENVNPSTRFGGTWELVDKEFSTTGGQGALTINSTNTTSESGWWHRSGHTIEIDLRWVNKVQLNDTDRVIGELDFETLGIKDELYVTQHHVGYTDGGNCALFVQVGSGGPVTVYDIVPDDYVTAGNSNYLTFTIQCYKDNMLDSACDKFYWKKTA